MSQPLLTLELIPRPTWGINLRSALKRSQWDRLRRAQFKVAGNVCEICGGRGRRHPVEGHEIWEFDENSHVQKLVGIIALCPPCHEVKHFGLAQSRGRGKAAIRHLTTVNQWTQQQALAHIDAAFAKWAERSTQPWMVDMSWLETQGIQV